MNSGVASEKQMNQLLPSRPQTTKDVCPPELMNFAPPRKKCLTTPVMVNVSERGWNY